MIILETERLKLIPLSLDDLKSCLTDKKSVEQKLGLKPGNKILNDRMKRIYQVKINNIMANQRDYLFNTYWLIVLKRDNFEIGEVGFKNSPNERGEIEVGYGIEEQYRGNGYMTEALKKLIDWVFDQYGARVLAVTACTDKYNIPSQRVLKKVQMKLYKEDEKYLWWKIDAK